MEAPNSALHLEMPPGGALIAHDAVCRRAMAQFSLLATHGLDVP